MVVEISRTTYYRRLFLAAHRALLFSGLSLKTGPVHSCFKVGRVVSPKMSPSRHEPATTGTTSRKEARLGSQE